VKKFLAITYLALVLSATVFGQEQKLPIQNNGKWGLIDYYGKVLIKPKYGKITVEKSIVKLISITSDSIGILNKNLNIHWFPKNYELLGHPRTSVERY